MLEKKTPCRLLRGDRGRKQRKVNGGDYALCGEDALYAEIRSDTRVTPVTTISVSVVETSVALTNEANTTAKG